MTGDHAVGPRLRDHLLVPSHTLPPGESTTPTVLRSRHHLIHRQSPSLVDQTRELAQWARHSLGTSATSAAIPRSRCATCSATVTTRLEDGAAASSPASHSAAGENLGIWAPYCYVVSPLLRPFTSFCALSAKKRLLEGGTSLVRMGARTVAGVSQHARR